MATQLKNIVQFVDVAAGTTTSLPHELNINGRSVAPDAVLPGLFGATFTVTADTTNVTVTNNDAVPRSLNVLVEHWHSIERAFGDVAVPALSPQPFIINPAEGLLSATQIGNTVIVDEVFGNDATGAREGPPFATVGAALGVAQPGDAVIVRPGIYEMPTGITLPPGVALYAATRVVLQMTNVTADTTLVTMGANSQLIGVRLRLTAVQHVALVGIDFPGTTTTSARVVQVRVEIDNSAAGAGNSDVIGVRSNGAGAALALFENLDNMNINVASTGGGTKRGILVAGPSTLTATDVLVQMDGAGIGIETNDPAAVFSGQTILVDGVAADISQTQGTLILGGATRLINTNANGLGFQASYTPSILVFADPGGLPGAATRYLPPGTHPATTSPVPVRLPQAAIIKSISVRMTNASGVGASTTFTVQRNSVDTIVAVSLAGATTSAQNSAVSAGFNAGDDLAIKVVTAGGSSAQDVVCVIELF